MTARSTLVSAQSELVKAARELNAATIGATKEGLEQLAKNGTAEGMTLTAIANSRLENENLKNDMRNIRAQIESTRSEIAQQEVNYKRLTLRAPDAGKVLRVLFEDGETVAAGTAAVLLETDRRYYDIFVSEDLVSRYQPGTRVKGFVPALNKEIEGTVRFVTAAPSFADLRNTSERGQSDLTSFQVRIYTDPDEALLTGMTVEVR